MNNRFESIQRQLRTTDNGGFAPVISKTANAVHKEAIRVLGRLQERPKHRVTFESPAPRVWIIIQKTTNSTNGRRGGFVARKDRIQNVHTVASSADDDDVLHNFCADRGGLFSG